jgi:RNA polymerase sigma-70 factor (ECF subfamily)
MSELRGLDRPAVDEHISQISTVWTVLFQAHHGSVATAHRALQQLVERYSRPVYRYLLRLVGDPEAADELFQEFALRLVRGAFKQADPGRCRFRDYLRSALRNLVIDYHRRQRRKMQPLGGLEPTVEDTASETSDAEFLADWRADLLTRSMKALAAFEQQTGQQLHTVLQLRVDQPQLDSTQMAELLAAKVGKPVTPGWVRKRLYLAREKLRKLLLEEIRASLGNPSEEEIVQELTELNLLKYFLSGLERPSNGRRQKEPKASGDTSL